MTKMSKQVRTMVEETNLYLKENHIKNESNDRFNMMCWLLLRAKCYHGFNYFTVDGRLAGGNNDDFDHLEFYIH